MVVELGTFGRWRKLDAWKVPSAVQACFDQEPSDPPTPEDIERVKRELLDADGIDQRENTSPCMCKTRHLFPDQTVHST